MREQGRREEGAGEEGVRRKEEGGRRRVRRELTCSLSSSGRPNSVGWPLPWLLL
jgi:hypothetical protein